MATKLVGKWVNLKPSVQTYATSGRVRSVYGEGQSALYEIDAVDATGYRQTLSLTRKQFTLRKPQ